MQAIESENRLERGDFAEVYAGPRRLMQISGEVQTRGWRIDCNAVVAANPFVRVQLPKDAAFYPDIKYFVDLAEVSSVQMVYESMPKAPCPATPSVDLKDR